MKTGWVKTWNKGCAWRNKRGKKDWWKEKREVG